MGNIFLKKGKKLVLFLNTNYFYPKFNIFINTDPKFVLEFKQLSKINQDKIHRLIKLYLKLAIDFNSDQEEA